MERLDREVLQEVVRGYMRDAYPSIADELLCRYIEKLDDLSLEREYAHLRMCRVHDEILTAELIGV